MRGEQVTQDGVVSSLTPRFVINDYVTAEVTYSTVHGHHDVLSWPGATFVLKTYRGPTRETPFAAVPVQRE